MRKISFPLLAATLLSLNTLPAQDTAATKSPAAAAQSPRQIATTEKLNRVVKGVEFKGTPLADVLEKISQAGELSITVIDKDRVRSGKCDIFLENVPLKALLTKALSQNRLDYRIENDGVVSIIRKSGPIEWSNNDTAGHDVVDLSSRLKDLQATADKLGSMTEAQKNSRVYVDEFMQFMQTRGEVYAAPSLTGEPIPESLNVLPPRKEALDDWMRGQDEKLEAAREAEYKAFEKKMAQEEQERQEAAAKEGGAQGEQPPQADEQPPPAEGAQTAPPTPGVEGRIDYAVRGKVIDGQHDDKDKQ